MAVGFAALGVAPASFGLTVALLSATGVVAGFYIIPLQSMLQSLSPDDARGRVLGTANGMSFVMGGAGSLLFMVLRQAGMPSNRIFLALAVACLAVGLAERRRLSRQPSLASSSP
jgi:sugar phosphate permease